MDGRRTEMCSSSYCFDDFGLNSTDLNDLRKENPILLPEKRQGAVQSSHPESCTMRLRRPNQSSKDILVLQGIMNCLCPEPGPLSWTKNWASQQNLTEKKKVICRSLYQHFYVSNNFCCFMLSIFYTSPFSHPECSRNNPPASREPGNIPLRGSLKKFLICKPQSQTWTPAVALTFPVVNISVDD